MTHAFKHSEEFLHEILVACIKLLQVRGESVVESTQTKLADHAESEPTYPGTASHEQLKIATTFKRRTEYCLGQCLEELRFVDWVISKSWQRINLADKRSCGFIHPVFNLFVNITTIPKECPQTWISYSTEHNQVISVVKLPAWQAPAVIARLDLSVTAPVYWSIQSLLPALCSLKSSSIDVIILFMTNCIVSLCRARSCRNSTWTMCTPWQSIGWWLPLFPVSLYGKWANYSAVASTSCWWVSLNRECSHPLEISKETVLCSIRIFADGTFIYFAWSGNETDSEIQGRVWESLCWAVICSTLSGAGRGRGREL